MEKITSRRNPLCVHLKKLGASRGYREDCGEFLCDGIKLLEEAMRSGAEILTVLTSSNVPFPLPIDTKVFYSERGLIDSLSPLKNSQDTLFSCKMPQTAKPELTKGTYILLDNVQDPGNVGAIIRTANAFGITGVILTGGSADRFNPKTIRASMGAVFRQYTFEMTLPELYLLKRNGFRFVGAASDKSCPGVHEIEIKNSIIAIGSEGKGLSNEISSLCDEKLTIRIAPDCESLNAAIAAAIIIWEAQK